MTRTVICEVCGQQFVAIRGHQKYCSAECRRTRKNRKTSEWIKANRSNPLKPKVCRGCGKTFMPVQHNQMYCSVKCRKKINREMAKEKPTGKFYCLNCGVELPPTRRKFCSKKCTDEYKTYKKYHKPKAKNKKLGMAVLELERYNKKHGTSYSYGEAVMRGII